jgi:ribonuclease-3
MKNSIESKINYSFKNNVLLEMALTHKSFANEQGCESYERLEFLGDAIIELIVSDYIIKYKELDAGELSKIRARLVSTDYLYNVSVDLELDKLVKKSKSLPKLSKKNTADLFESLIGAIYLDGDFQKCKELITKYILIDDKNIASVIKNSEDYKTLLQEYCQSKNMNFAYSLVKSEGLDHDKTFFVSLDIMDTAIWGEGKSIQQAEEECARKFMQSLK